MKKRNTTARVGFDLGGTKMMATVYDANFKALATVKVKTPVDEGPQVILARVRETICLLYTSRCV